MDKLEKLYNMLKEDGHTEDDYATFKEHYSKPENKETLHSFLTKEQYYTKDLPTFEAQFFQSEGEKKKPADMGGSVDAGVGLGTDSPNTEVPAVAPKNAFKYGSGPVSSPVMGSDNATTKQRESGEITGEYLGKSEGGFLSNPYGKKRYEPGKNPELTYTKKPDGSVVVKGTYGTVAANDKYWERMENGGFNYIGPRDLPADKRPLPLVRAEAAALGTDQDDDTLDEPKMSYESVPNEMRPGSGVLSEKEQRDRSYTQHFGPRLTYSAERDEPKGLSGEMGKLFDKFQKYKNQSTVAAQENTMKAAQGDLEAVRKQREAHPERYKGLDEKGKQEMYAKEDARALEIQNNPQPLTTRLLDYYKNRVGAPDASGDRSQRALEQFNYEVVGTPKGAELEQKLQRIYKTVKPGDSRSLENALLDAKGLVLKTMGDKNTAIWEDFAKTNSAFADYDPQGYHQRLNGQINEKYSAAGIPEDQAYDNLMEYTLERGVMDEDRTHEAKMMMDAGKFAKDLQRAKDEGNQVRIDAAQYQYDQAMQGVQGMQKERLAAVDKEISDIKGLMTMENPPRPMAELKAGLAKAEAAKAGFINPNAKIEATYALHQQKADAALPEGTPMEKLKRLYAELEWDRQQTARRIVEAEGGGARGGANEMINSLGGGGHNDDHRRLLELDAQIKDLAPIVFLNESPAIQDKKAGFSASAWNGLLTTMGGKGSPMSGSTRQEDAVQLQRNLQIAGVSPEILNDPSLNGIANRTKEPGLGDSEYWGNLLGTSGGLMFHIMLAQSLTKGVGMGNAINSLVKAGQAATKAGRVGGATLALLGDAVESGLNYQGAGMLSVDNKDELSFAGGFFGGAAASLGKQGFNAASKVVGGLFGNKAGEAVKLISDFGAKRIGAGIGESFEETGQQITQMWQQSSTGQEFWDKMGKQFGDLPEAVKFYVSTMVMGMSMGSAHSDGFGKYLEDYAKTQIDNMGPEDRAIAEEMTQEIENDAQNLIAGARAENAPDLVLTPEAQAAQAELEKSRKVAESMGEGAEGRTIEDSVPEGSTLEQHMADRMDEDIRALETRLENPDISPGLREKLEAEIEQKKKAKTGFEQMRDNTAFVEDTKAPEGKGKTKPQNILEDLAAQGVMLDMEDVGALENDQQIPGKIYDTDGTEILPSDPRHKAAMETIHNWIQDSGKESSSPTAETITTNSGDVIESVEGSPTKKKVTLDDGTEWEADLDMDEMVSAINTDEVKSMIAENFLPATEETSLSPAAQENTAGEQTLGEEPMLELNTVPIEQSTTTDKSIVDVTEEAPTPIAAEEGVVEIDDKNLMSAGSMTVSTILETLVNPSKWKRAFRDAWKAKDGEKIRILLRSSPDAEFNEIQKQFDKDKATVRAIGAEDRAAAFSPTNVSFKEKTEAIKEFLKTHLGWDIESITIGGSSGARTTIFKMDGKEFVVNDGFFSGSAIGGISPSFDPEDIVRAKANAEVDEYNKRASEETVVGESPAPVIQKKGKGAANGGKSKPKANPNRKTKSKPVADLSPTEVVSEALAVSAEVDENPTPENKEREAQIEQKIEEGVAGEAEVVAESPTITKEKAKSRGKEQFDEGVEDQFIVANIRGARTVYRKKNGVWESREHKGKISDNKFRNEWTPVEDEDMPFVERMAAKDPLDLEVANAAKEWISAWGNFVKLRWAGDGKMFSGEMFSRPDLGLMTPVADITLKTFKLGIAVAKKLADQGRYTKARWEESMLKYVGEHIRPMLAQAWENTQQVIREGATSAEDVETRVTEPKEKSKKVKQKRGERGTYRTMEQYEEDNGGAIKQVLDAVKRSYKRMNFGQLFDSAAKAVEDAGGFIKDFGNMMADPAAPWEMAMQQAKRMLGIRFFGQLADQLQSDIDAATDPAQKESLAKLRDMAIKNVDALMTKVAENNTEMGQATATMSQWRFLLENTAGYAQAKIAEYNAELMDPSSKAGKTEAGKKRHQRKKTIVDTVNESVADIETSEAVDQAVDAIENEEEIKPKKTSTKPKKDYTSVKKKIAATKAEGLALMKSAVRKAGGSLQSGGLMAIPEFVEGASKYGFALVAEGAITFKEWADKMRSDIPEMTDSDIQEVWDTAVDEDGKSLSDTAAEEVKKAATPKKRTAKQKVTLRGKIRKAINDHFKKDAEPTTLEQRLVDDVDLTMEEAALVVEAVQAELDARLKKKLDQRVKSLKRKKPTGTKSKPKTDTERVVEALTDGSLTDDMVNEIFADRIGLQTPLDPEQMAKARALGQALSDTTPKSHAERIAAMALDRFMYQVLPGPGGVANFFEIFRSIVYANMLMGIPTHMKNLMSAGSMTVSTILETLVNPSKWKRAFRDAWKAKDGEKIRILLRSSPLTEMMVKFAVIGRGIANGAPIAWDITNQGFVDSKYVTQGKAQAGRLSPILERQQFGGKGFNPMNWFKYVGRALSAEDVWMTAINSEMELADAVRRHFLDSSVRGGIAPLTREVSRRMAKSNPEYASALAQAEVEIDAIAGALELTSAERARAIKIKANELLVESLGLTEEERQQAEDISKSRVFTLTRNGIWGKTARLMNKINASKGFGSVSWIFMPFTTIIGNIGDTVLDYTPIYGLLRANGISPTGIAQSLGLTETSAMMSNRLEGSAMDRAKKLLGSRKDQRYYEQMGRAWFGTISMLGAALFMGESDDDDDFIRLTGKDNAEYKNFIVIGGVPIVSWELIPSVAPVAAIISEMQSFHKQHPKEDRSLSNRIMYAMGTVEQSVAGMSVAESVQSLNQVIGTLLSSATGVGNYGNKVDLQKGIQTMLKDLTKQGLDVLGRVNPLRNAIVGQIQQIFDPRVFSHSDLDQSLEYAGLGVFYRTTKDNDSHDKMAMVDIFGEEVKRLPADDVFGFLSWFKEDKMKDKKWKFLTEHGLVEMLRPPRNSNMLFTDSEDEFGVVSKKMTEHQYGTFARLAGKNFSNELTRYMSSPEKVKKDYETVVVENSGNTTQLKKEVMKLLSKSRTKAKKDMDRMTISQGGFAKTRK